MRILASNSRVTPPFDFIRTTEALPVENVLVYIRYTKIGFTGFNEAFAQLVSSDDGFWFVKNCTKDKINLRMVHFWKYVYILDCSKNNEA